MSLDIIKKVIPFRSESEHLWVVRASGGRFVEHFLRHGIVAIGHLDSYQGYETTSPTSLSREDIRRILNQVDEKGNQPTAGTLTNQVNQVESFIKAINVNDLILTIDDRKIAVGRVTGDCIFSDQEISISIGSGKKKRESRMPYKTRRNVTWGPTFSRSELPLKIENSFRAHQAVFNADRHWEHIYHLIYPIFADVNNLYFSTIIRQKKDINSFCVSQLLGFFGDVEVILKCADVGEFQNLEDLYRIFGAQYTHELICRAQFFSEGPVWWKQPIDWIADYKNAVTVILVFQALFGGSFAGISFPGLITPEMREKILSVIIEAYENRSMEETKNRLQLDYPRQDASPIQNPNYTIIA